MTEQEIANEREKVERDIEHGFTSTLYRGVLINIEDDADGWEYVWPGGVCRNLEEVFDSIDTLRDKVPA